MALFFSTKSIANPVRQVAGLKRFRDQKRRWFLKLTEREVEVLTLLAAGLKNPAIAERLDISRTTVQNHRSQIRSKLHIKNQSDYIRFGLAYDLIQF